MLRILGTMLSAVLALGLLSACGDDDGGEADAGPATLEVTSQGWTGWSREQPEPETTRVTVSEGDTFQVAVIGDDATFTVVEVSDDRVRLEADQSFSLTEPGGGISLTDTETGFEVSRPGVLEIATPSMDAGTHVTFRIE